MSTLVLKAHYDGEHIVLDEPCELSPNTPLSVTVLTPGQLAQDSERAAWADLAAESLARAYGDDEPEYSVADLKS
jgi:hypothetical protein